MTERYVAICGETMNELKKHNGNRKKLMNYKEQLGDLL